MKKFRVYVERTIVEAAYIEVEASDRNEAKKKAVQSCEEDDNFPEFGADVLMTKANAYGVEDSEWVG